MIALYSISNQKKENHLENDKKDLKEDLEDAVNTVPDNVDIADPKEAVDKEDTKVP